MLKLMGKKIFTKFHDDFFCLSKPVYGASDSTEIKVLCIARRIIESSYTLFGC